MTAAMTTTKTTTTIMMVVVLSFLGLAPSGTVLFPEKKIKSVQASKSKTIFLEKTKHKIQMNKTVSFTI